VAAKGTVEQTLRAVERGWTTIPPGVDVGDFLLSGGRISIKPNVPRILTLRELFNAYFTSLPEGSLEACTIAGMRQHSVRNAIALRTSKFDYASDCELSKQCWRYTIAFR
jgi:hypothetical protein